MEYDCTLRTVAPQFVAANRDRVALSEIGARYGPSLDVVWQFVRSAGLTTNHNVFLYDHGPPPLVQFCVQVGDRFDDAEHVECVEIPGGTIATALHVGQYGALGDAHAAVQAWCNEQHHEMAGSSWEIYGDWDDDPSKLETQVCYLLRA